MQQSNVIFAYILIAYLFYITLKGEFSTYIDLLRGGGQEATPSVAGSAAGQIGGVFSSFYNGVKSLLNNQLGGGTVASPAQNADLTSTVDSQAGTDQLLSILGTQGEG
jgi:hypothetical protein